MYLTFVLRALGYKDGKDFVWYDARKLATELNIIDDTIPDEGFLRFHVAKISFNALSKKCKGSSQGDRYDDRYLVYSLPHNRRPSDSIEWFIEEIVFGGELPIDAH